MHFYIHIIFFKYIMIFLVNLKYLKYNSQNYKT